MLLLTIKHPWITNAITIGCISRIVPAPQTPNGTLACVQPLLTHHAMVPASPSDVGIGVPSKYFDFPVPSLGNMATVTLKRARRVRPQRTKKARRMWSSGVRIPRAKAAQAGDTPKETC